MGEVEPGKTVQAVDNNMFLAPIQKHSMPNTDFLLVKIGTKWYIR
jgi:transcription initiation factor TFIID subunit 1